MSDLKRSDCVVFFFRDGELHARNFLTDEEVTAEPVLVPVLARLDDRRVPAELCRLFPEYSPASVRRALAALALRGLVITRDSKQAQREKGLALWKSCGMEALLFHFGTKHAHRQKPVTDETPHRFSQRAWARRRDKAKPVHREHGAVPVHVAA